MSTLTSKLVLSLVDRVTAPARSIRGSVARLNDMQRQNNARLTEMNSRMVGATATAYALAKGISAPITAATQFESAMADVRKVVDFANPQEFKQMSRDIVDLSTKLPMTAEGIADIVAAAGQSNIAKNELFDFAKMAAKVGIAFDISAGQAGQSLAEMKTALGLTVAQTGSLADAINHLSNTSASSAPSIIDYMKTAASAGRQYGFSAEQTAAIGSAMIAAGAQSNVAATSFRNVGKALTKGASATTRTRKGFKAIGLEAKAVAKAMQKDAVGTLRDVLERIGKLPEHLRASNISDLFGDEARALAPLVNDLKLYDKAMAAVSNQANYLGSSQKEFEARAKTTANSIQLLRNQIKAVGIAIGEALLPALNNTMTAIAPVLNQMTEWARANPELVSTIVQVTAAIAGLRIVTIGLKYAFLLLKGQALAMTAGAMGGVSAALKGIGIAATWTSRKLVGMGLLAIAPFKAVLNGARAARRAMVAFALSAQLTGIASASGMALRSIGASMMAALNPIKLVTGAMRALKFAIIGTGIGAILVGIVAAGTFIYNNWNGIKSMFQGIGEGFMEALGPIPEFLKPVSDTISSLFSVFSSLTGEVSTSSEQWHSWGKTIGQIAGGGVQTLLNAIRSVAGALEAVWNMAKGAAEAVGNFFSGGTSAKGIGMPSEDGGWSGKARALGGHISGGSTYLVGEHGPELVTPTRSGHVHTARNTEGMLSGSPTINIGGSTINVGHGMSIDAIIEKAKDEFVQDLRDALSGGHFDPEWT